VQGGDKVAGVAEQDVGEFVKPGFVAARLSDHVWSIEDIVGLLQ
jgi:hypothetical protein